MSSSSCHLASPSSRHLVSPSSGHLASLPVTSCHPFLSPHVTPFLSICLSLVCLFSAVCLNVFPSPFLQVSSIWSSDLFQPARSEDENACATMAGVMGVVTSGNPGAHMVDSLLGPTLQPPGFNEER